ncbi:GAF and ANTAR domain-containing protein [Quadrisphaera sp. DSM 44207]|uniref:GAF and ANTAR domain-containing protein n=1 Tax=Quadrisphaera sp. DSM 44207 TaxID=1881057 RepID=UPI00088B704E|nr:GAF and ANTAR domain-containing protein [Quadrisphaera sp. DSM 44207]SDQ54105.1 GAF domain-containing protein [Quadrisphaera sp. DSM 44207]
MSDDQGPPADQDDLATQLADLARTLEQEDDVQATLDAIVQAVVATVPGAQHASLSSIERRREVITRASTSDLPRAVDHAQYETEQGPCLDTLFERQTARIPDVDAEERWPDFAARARQLGAGSMLAVQLYVHGEGGDLGSLNLLSEEANAFDEESEHVALLFAAHAAVAMVGAQEQDQLRTALGSRDVIGQAKGILMERFTITADQAFALLVRASQHGNRKLVDVAAALTRTGQLSS